MELLSNWKAILGGSIALILLVSILYAVHLYHEVDSLQEANKQLTGQVGYISGYVRTIQGLQAENKALSDKFLAQLENAHDDQKCPISKPVRDVVSRLPR